MDPGIIAIIVIAGLAAIALLYGIAIYNGLVGRRNQVENAWRQIDVQLKRRHDLIPNLVEIVKDYMGYEQETLQAVIEARAKALGAHDGPREESIAAEGLLGAALGQLFALSESYPELKANETVMKLQEELTTTENRISFARQHYNDSVMSLNTKIEIFPSNLIARNFGFTRETYFEVPEGETEPVKVDLR